MSDQDKEHRHTEYLPQAFARHQIVTGEDGNPIDYIFLEVNAAYEKMAGLSRDNIVGKKVTEIHPGIEKTEFDWIGTFGRVATTGKSICFNEFYQPTKKHYDISAFSDEQGTFSTVYHATTKDVAEKFLQESEAGFNKQSADVVWPAANKRTVNLADVIDVEAYQAMLDEFFKLTGFGVAIVDIEGNVLVRTGWQEICTRFHRVHPVTAQLCIESDTKLSSGVGFGEFKLYKCKNNMWDIASPIIAGGKHLGNLFLGQFFFEDAGVDEAVFRDQARKYGFNEKEYLEALSKVPRWSRDTVNTVMHFYTILTTVISRLGYSNMNLARMLMERDSYITERKRAEEELQFLKNFNESIVQNINEGIIISNSEGNVTFANPALLQMLGYTADEFVGSHWTQIVPPQYHQVVEAADTRRLEGQDDRYDLMVKHKNGTLLPVQISGSPYYDYKTNTINGSVAVLTDISELKKAEKALKQSEEQYRTLSALKHNYGDVL